MAYTKCIFAVLAALAIFNVEAAKLGFRNENNINKGFDNIAKEYLEIIEEAVHIYQEILKDVAANTTGNIREELVKALEELSKTVEHVLNGLQEIKSHSKNAKECIAKYMPEVMALVEKTQETQTACVQGSIEKIEEIHNKLVADLAGVREQVTAIIAEIQKCKDRDCLKQNGAKLLELVKEVKGRVREAIMEAVAVIEANSPEAIECVKGASDNFNVEIKKIREEVIACIKA